MPSTAQIASEVATARKLAMLTQQQAADRADIGKTTLRNVEYGNANPTVATLHKIAVGLGYTSYDHLSRAVKEARSALPAPPQPKAAASSPPAANNPDLLAPRVSSPAEMLEEARTLQELTRVEVAKRIGWSTERMKQVERDKRWAPRRTTLHKVARALGYSNFYEPQADVTRVARRFAPSPQHKQAPGSGVASVA